MKRRIKRKFTVTIGNQYSTNVLAETKGDAINYAIPKIFGHDCFWFPDFGVPECGQVFRVMKKTNYNAAIGNIPVTDKVMVNVHAVSPMSPGFKKQLMLDQEQANRVNAEISKRFEEQEKRKEAEKLMVN
jgi:hypothetical protein